MFESSRWLQQLGEIAERAALDPPHRAVARLASVAVRTGLVGELAEGAIVDSVKTLLGRGMTVGSIHRLHAVNHPDRDALVDAHRRVTYRQADREIDQLAAQLEAQFGVGGGEPLAMMTENRSEYVVAWFATFRLGASGVHVSYRATPEELIYKLEHSGARVVVCSERTRPVVEEVMARRPDLGVEAIDCDAQASDATAHSYHQLIAAAGPGAGPTRRGASGATSEIANIVYTSGTTGRPKGTVRDFAKLGPFDLASILERLPVRAGDEHLVVTPIYHSGGQVFTLLNAALGATVHLLPDFEPSDTLEVLSERGINSLFMVPTMIRRLLDCPQEVHRRTPTPDLRVLISGAAPFSEALRRRAIQRFGARTVHDFYGATELGWVTLIDGMEMLQRPGSVGRPIAAQQVRILDDAGRECAPGEVGQIWVRSPHTMTGYLHDEDANDEFRRDGWVTVEDLGYVDDDGYLYLAGRARDMVISGGVNVYPVEIEDVLVDHPDVDDAGVIGVEDEQWGEKLVAFVVPAGGGFDPEELEAWVREKLAGYKVPRDWRRADELPRNQTGKIVKRQLEEEYEDSV